VRIDPALGFVGSEVLLGNHHGSDSFPGAVGKPDHGQLLDDFGGGVELFDLVGVNVLSVRVDDDLLGATNDVEVAFFVQPAQVPGEQPPVAQSLFRRRFVSEVTRHHVGAAGDTLPLSVGLVNPDLDPGKRPPDTSRDDLPRGGDGKNGRASVRP
jgi:hypothetical protein